MERYYRQKKVGGVWGSPTEFSEETIIHFPPGEWRIIDSDFTVIMTVKVNKRNRTIFYTKLIDPEASND